MPNKICTHDARLRLGQGRPGRQKPRHGWSIYFGGMWSMSLAFPPGALMSFWGATLLNDIIIHEEIFLPDKILENLRQKLILTLGQNKDHVCVKDGIEGLVISYNP